MKKLLSSVLALVMVFATFAMLIPTAMATSSGGPRVLYEQNFDNAALASLQDEALATALFGANVPAEGETPAVVNYTYASGGKLSIEDGKLHIDNTANSGNFEFLLSTDEAISDGVVVEVEYVFGERTAGADARFLMFTTKAKMGTGDLNTLLVAPYNGAASRTAWRNAGGTWTQLKQGPSVDASGTQGVKYKMKGTFSYDDGAVLQVAKWDDAASAYGGYETLGKWEGDELTNFQSVVNAEGAVLLNDMMIMRVQNANNVTIDNLKVTTLAKSDYTIKINGTDTTVSVDGELDLKPYMENPDAFQFAVVDGKVVKATSVAVDANTRQIDTYCLTLDTLDGAALTTGTTASLRWLTTVSKAEYDALAALKTANTIKNVEYGVLYMDYDTLGIGGNLELTTEGVQKVVATDWASTTAYEGMYLFAGDTAAIAEADYNKGYAGVGYMTITFNDDTTATVYGGYNRYVHKRSAAEVALAAVADFDNGLTDAQLATVEAIAAKYVD